MGLNHSVSPATKQFVTTSERNVFFPLKEKTLLTQILLILVVSAIYYFAARFGLTLAFKGTNASPVWPPTGIALSAVILFGYRIWPAIAIGAFLANYITGLSPLFAFVISVGNTLEALAGGFFIRYFCMGHSFVKDMRNTLCFLIPVSMGSTMISATIGAASLILGGYSGGASFTYLWWTWWLGDTVGNIVITPLILSFVSTRVKLWDLRTIQIFIGMLFSAVAVSLLIFGPWFQQGYMLLYFTLGLIVIATFHVPLLGITILCTVISAIAIWGTKSLYGPFMLGNLNESLLLLQIYIGTVTATGMILTAVLNEKKAALLELQNARNNAESIAGEKTVLLQELHHRVKNNLQVIVSLLNIHGRNLSFSDAQTIFQECVNRIKVIGNIHDALYGSTNIARADFSDYIRSLAGTLLSAYARNTQKVDLEISVEPLFLNPDKAITLGMVLNELINNSCKHAFTDGTDGEIRIDLKKSESKMMLSYTDNGKGIPSLSEDRENPPIGMRLLSLLVKQLNGTMRYKSSHLGTVFQIEFIC